MMNKEELISKWLDNNLTPEEFKAFKALEDYDELVKLDTHLNYFKAEAYDASKTLENVLSSSAETQPLQKPKTAWLKPLLAVAAVVAISFCVFYYTSTLNTTVNTQLAQKTTITLPDASTVAVNAQSSITYNKSNWKNNREVALKGEAYFKVAKGASFNVKTDLGLVTVYGTAFNVKQRGTFFEVVCYEGLVGVTYNSKETKLHPGDRFLIIEDKQLTLDNATQTAPSWIKDESTFSAIPFKFVVAEFERQYNTKVTLIDIDSSQLFTGSFTHNDMEIALKAIALPLHATYSLQNQTIILKRD